MKGHLHRVFQQTIHKQAKSEGNKAKIEAEVKGKRIDLLVSQQDGLKVAYEIEMSSKSGFSNIEKDLDMSKVDKVVSCYRQKLDLEATRKKVEKERPDLMDKIEFMLLVEWIK